MFCLFLFFLPGFCTSHVYFFLVSFLNVWVNAPLLSWKHLFDFRRATSSFKLLLCDKCIFSNTPSPKIQLLSPRGDLVKFPFLRMEGMGVVLFIPVITCRQHFCDRLASFFIDRLSSYKLIRCQWILTILEEVL